MVLYYGVLILTMSLGLKRGKWIAFYPAYLQFDYELFIMTLDHCRELTLIPLLLCILFRHFCLCLSRPRVLNLIQQSCSKRLEILQSLGLFLDSDNLSLALALALLLLVRVVLEPLLGSLLGRLSVSLAV